MRIVIAMVGVWLLAAAGWAGAGEAKNLYLGEVPVASQDEAAGKAAMPGALRTVLGKLLPRESLADAALMKSLLGQAVQLVQSCLKATGGPAALEQLLSGAHWQRSGEPDGEVLRYRWQP